MKRSSFTVLAVLACCLITMAPGNLRADIREIPDNFPLHELHPEEAESGTLEELLHKQSTLDTSYAFATYYASRFSGRRTASGAVYHPDKLTAAHYSLPLGTVVKVLNPATNQEVLVTINDRCAAKPFNFIDLSRAAAKKIGLWGKGKTKVVIIPLLEEPA